MKNLIFGFLLAYTILLSCFTWGLYHGKVASSQQACVTRTGVVPLESVTDIQVEE